MSIEEIAKELTLKIVDKTNFHRGFCDKDDVMNFVCKVFQEVYKTVSEVSEKK